MSKRTILSSGGFLIPAGLFIAGILTLSAGLAINHFNGLKGIIQLESGKAVSIKTSSSSEADVKSPGEDLGMMMILDSMSINSYTPEFEIIVSKKDTAQVHSDYQAGATYSIVDRFPLEQMKIRKIEGTDLAFRMKDFFPNFEFAYQYPEFRDTIQPIAPGITLQLTTKAGTNIVTLRSDQPGKNLLGDIVGLGASLAFYWNMPMDSVQAIVEKQSNKGDKIIFSGSDTTLYFIINDSIRTERMQEKVFYKIPGQDSAGFMILFCYPNIAYLKAVPSSNGSEMNNPVAHVELWKQGGSATDAYLYPETQSRKGGDFDIPGSAYRLGLGINKAQAISHCNCFVSLQKDSTEEAETLSLLSGKPGRKHGYRFTPVECKVRGAKTVLMEVHYLPGRVPVMLGLIMIGLGLLAYLLKKNQQISVSKS